VDVTIPEELLRCLVVNREVVDVVVSREKSRMTERTVGDLGGTVNWKATL
jgi:hypothetical protein